MDEPADSTASGSAELTIYTIGHSNHSPDAFLSLLRQHQIELLVDVRSSPYSRYVTQANRETLSQALNAGGVAYHWLGDYLGGKPNGAVADYDELRQSPGYRQGIDALLGLARERRTAIMCSEGDHRSCHRYKLITPSLADRGLHVIHIQPDGSAVDETQQPRQLSLF